jgi:hypothetical protein
MPSAKLSSFVSVWSASLASSMTASLVAPAMIDNFRCWGIRIAKGGLKTRSQIQKIYSRLILATPSSIAHGIDPANHYHLFVRYYSISAGIR